MFKKIRAKYYKYSMIEVRIYKGKTNHVITMNNSPRKDDCSFTSFIFKCLCM